MREVLGAPRRRMGGGRAFEDPSERFAGALYMRFEGRATRLLFFERLWAAMLLCGHRLLLTSHSV